jgi:hypothetical protein
VEYVGACGEYGEKALYSMCIRVGVRLGGLESVLD